MTDEQTTETPDTPPPDLNSQVAALEQQLSAATEELSKVKEDFTNQGALLESKEQELSALREADAEKSSTLETTSNSLMDAIQRYRNLALVQVPDAVAELVVGDTVDAIDSSLEVAKGIVDKVRTTVATENRQNTIPSGAPERTTPEWREMSAREKIAFAIGAAKKED